MDEVKYYSTEEVSKHNHAKDCWVIIDCKVYDVTKWVPKHPGGGLIYVSAGKDCTQLFDSYHPDSAWKVLDKYYIGEVQNKQDLFEFKSQGKELEFYTELKKRVYGYFRENQLNPRTNASVMVFAAFIVMTNILSYFGTFYWTTPFMVSLLCAISMGATSAMVGTSIQHDANHGAMSTNTTLGYLMGITLDLVGASSYCWKQQHVSGHHVYTNIAHIDPDIRCSEKDVRRVAPSHPLHEYHALQHIYLWALYGLLSIKSVTLDDFMAMATGYIGTVKLTPMTWHERLVFWGSKAFFYTYYVVLPLYYSHHGLGTLIVLWLSAQAITGWMLALMFQVAHVSADVDMIGSDEFQTSTKQPMTTDSAHMASDNPPGLTKRTGTNRAYQLPDATSPATNSVTADSAAGGKKTVLERGWAVMQLNTTANFASQSLFWTHVSGGLNCQIEHHFFPGINHGHYPKIAPIVKQVCKEYGYRYVEYSTFLSAVHGHFKQLQNMSFAPSIPSLATIG